VAHAFADQLLRERIAAGHVPHWGKAILCIDMSARSFNFGPGNPDPGVFPSRELAAAAQRVIEREGHELAHYPEQLGLPELRAVAAERFERNHGTRPPLEDIFITNGAMQALQLCALGLAQPGDSVVLEEFEYSGTIRVFKQFGLQLVGVPLDDQGMRVELLPDVLAQHKPTFIYTTASYQNPTGTTMPAARRERLTQLAQQHGVPIVEDDTYGDISFEPQAERAIYTMAEPGTAVYIGSFSKILGPGIRLGFMIAPQPLQAKLLACKTDGGTSALSQMIAAEYFREHLWSHVEEGRQAVKEKRNVLLDALEVEFGGIDGMRWTQPDGGLFVWISLPEQLDRTRLQELATSRNITYATGQAFHADGHDVAYMRLAFGWIEREDIPVGVKLLAECVREAMPAPVGSA
jgi:2-aminoadipate transaminase